MVLLLSLLAAALALIEAPLGVRLPLGIMAVLLLPGYSLTAAVFPHADDLEGNTRLAFAFALSFAILVVIALALNYSPWGFAFTPIVVAVTTWTVSVTALAWWRRSRLSPPERFGVSLGLGGYRLAGGSGRLAFTALVAVLLLAGTALALTLSARPAPLTEFYILGPEGLAEGYPREVDAGAPWTLTIGIVNREGAAAAYRLQVRSGGTTLASADPIALGSGKSWQGPISVTLSDAGKNQQVELVLFKDPGVQPYRLLRLWLDVTPRERGR